VCCGHLHHAQHLTHVTQPPQSCAAAT
jgi:hypothetical protein